MVAYSTSRRRGISESGATSNWWMIWPNGQRRFSPFWVLDKEITLIWTDYIKVSSIQPCNLQIALLYDSRGESS
jgi:hypothetical protein